MVPTLKLPRPVIEAKHRGETKQFVSKFFHLSTTLYTYFSARPWGSSSLRRKRWHSRTFAAPLPAVSSLFPPTSMTRSTEPPRYTALCWSHPAPAPRSPSPFSPLPYRCAIITHTLCPVRLRGLHGCPAADSRGSGVRTECPTGKGYHARHTSNLDRD